jgi:hypothetical protein
VRRFGRFCSRPFRPTPTTLSLSAAAVVSLFSLAILAFNPEQDNANGPVPTRWASAQVIWSLNPSANNVITAGGTDISTTITDAFKTWQQAQVGGQSLLSLIITRGPDTTANGVNSSDCVNTISFMDPNASADFPSGTIAVTFIATVFGSPTGGTYSCTSPPTSRSCPLRSCIADGDIVFNPAEQFSTTTPPAPNAFDLQSVATHEIGHLLGLDHSGIAHAVMYPFGDTSAAGVQRTLSVDDAAGISFLYPNSSFAAATGTVSGSVLLGPTGAFAAHVVAIDAATGNAVIDGLTDTQGHYSLTGVPPGTYNVLALPLAGAFDIMNFTGWECGYTSNPLNCTGFPATPTNYTGKFY